MNFNMLRPTSITNVVSFIVETKHFVLQVGVVLPTRQNINLVAVT